VCFREEIQEKYEGKLSKEMQGLEYEIISRLMKTLVNRKITVPGSFVGYVRSSYLFHVISSGPDITECSLDL
jgi:hypothetical protein